MKGGGTPRTTLLLLTNIQLLNIPDLDPKISIETFTMGKNKSKAFEHIAYHLFNTYDSASTNTKFKGCWPVYEPAQAKAFRVAALAWITDLKKLGSLQGNVIIRKSLLDDCSGERYEELMLSLSTLVLQTELERRTNSKPLAHKPGDVTVDAIVPLTIAFQHSLTQVLNKRSKDKQSWHDLNMRLSEKERILSDKTEDEAPPKETSSEQVLLNSSSIIKRWNENWVTDDVLLKCVSQADSLQDPNDLLNQPFERAFNAANEEVETSKDSKTSTATTLSSLHDQVLAQEARLNRLRKRPEHKQKRESGFPRAGGGGSGGGGGGITVAGLKTTQEGSENIGSKIDLSKHQNPITGSSQPPSEALPNEYEDLLQRFRAESNINSNSRKIS